MLLVEAGAATARTRGSGGKPFEERLPQVPGYRGLETTAGMWQLTVETIRALVRPPYTWLPDLRAECATAFRRVSFPLFVSLTFFSIGLVITAIAGILETLGTSDRTGGGMVTGWPRETGYWVTSMLFAGVVGSAMTADLGARKIREELDALAVLGVDRVRALVVPRVLALTLAAPVLGMLAVLVGAGWVYVLGPIMVSNLTHGSFIDTARGFITSEDYISLMLRCMVTGFFVGIVCCYKGLTAKGGAEGVGRAVNEAVLITFISLWLLNSLWNAVLLSQFPLLQVLRG
jgi:phospholipid/cholesterol/gamma-HCH transport system permease protein